MLFISIMELFAVTALITDVKQANRLVLCVFTNCS
jgi:hypothetical protein